MTIYIFSIAKITQYHPVSLYPVIDDIHVWLRVLTGLSWQVIKHESKDAGRRPAQKRALKTEVACGLLQRCSDEGGGSVRVCQD